MCLEKICMSKAVFIILLLHHNETEHAELKINRNGMLCNMQIIHFFIHLMKYICFYNNYKVKCTTSYT